LILTPMLYGVAIVVRPIVWTLNAVSNGILRLFRFEPRDEADTAYTLDEVEGIVTESTKEGVLQDGSGAIFKTFEFTEKIVKDVAVSVDSLISLKIDATANDMQTLVAEHGFSRYPVVKEDGEIVGYWHLKDALPQSEAELEQVLPSRKLRTMISIPESVELEDALAQMRQAGAHIARSFSASGEVVGCLFLEDIIEELVGEIEDATRR